MGKLFEVSLIFPCNLGTGVFLSGRGNKMLLYESRMSSFSQLLHIVLLPNYFINLIFARNQITPVKLSWIVLGSIYSVLCVLCYHKIFYALILLRVDWNGKYETSPVK